MADFRRMAHDYLTRAKAEMASGDDHRLRYAALEIRFCMEAITYGRAQAYKSEIPPEEFSTWQPRKVLDYLTEIDPHAALTSTITITPEVTPGVPDPAAKPITFGTDVALTVNDLKKHYSAIGGYLHPPTLDKIDEPDALNPARLRKRCEDCIAILGNVLSSQAWHFTVGQFSEMSCKRCGKTVRRRLHPQDEQAVDTRCFECNAGYTIEQKDDMVIWKSKVEQVSCPTTGCSEKIAIWKDQIKPGSYWTCNGCKRSYQIALGITQKDTH